MEQLRHKHILVLYAVASVGDPVYIVTELPGPRGACWSRCGVSRPVGSTQGSFPGGTRAPCSLEGVGASHQESANPHRPRTRHRPPRSSVMPLSAGPCLRKD